MPKLLTVKYITEDRGQSTPCWIWQGCLRGGYGMIANPNYDGSNGKMVQAHVYYYEKEYGVVPTGLVLDHICNQRSCVNPAHLDPKTHTDNIRRGRVPVVNENTVADIRLLLAEGMRQVDIAAKFGISQPTVSQIARNLTWK